VVVEVFGPRIWRRLHEFGSLVDLSSSVGLDFTVPLFSQDAGARQAFFQELEGVTLPGLLDLLDCPVAPVIVVAGMRKVALDHGLDERRTLSVTGSVGGL